MRTNKTEWIDAAYTSEIGRRTGRKHQERTAAKRARQFMLGDKVHPMHRQMTNIFKKVNKGRSKK